MSLSTKIVKKNSGNYLVKLNGKLDTDTYLQLEDELRGIIHERTEAINLDMKDLDYISSAGIRTVMWARKTLRQQDAVFSISNLQPQIHEVFEVMKLAPAVNIFKDLEEADKYIDHVISQELKKNK